ncbi:hypothetical protein [Pseudonocardia sp. GCM10023141]|uniref:hypothetical protein n=1 Tax=Pseudonocardia sp. GCM10023141 TaxID=3252653 RepID=UPI00360E7104
MFDPLTPAQLVAMLGDLLRDAARWDRPLDDFRSAQLLSAGSVARYLAVELAGADAELARFADRVGSEIDRATAAATDPSWTVALDRGRRGVTTDVAVLGSGLVDLLRASRECTDPDVARFRTAVHGLLAELVDRHVVLLGGAP